MPLDDEPRHPTWRTLDRGQDTGLDAPMREVVTDEARWEVVWEMHRAAFSGPYAPPAVNFSREHVVVFVLDEQGSGCWHATIENMTERGAWLEVPVSVYTPPPQAVCGAVMVKPYHIVAVETRATRAEFEERETTRPAPAPQERPHHDEVVLELRHLASGEHSGIREARETMLPDEEAWHAFWQTHASPQEPKPAPPEVRFEHEIVLAVVLDEKPSSGYQVVIHRVVLESGTLHVEYRWNGPQGQLTVMTQPHHFVAVTPPGEVLRVQYHENGPPTP